MTEIVTNVCRFRRDPEGFVLATMKQGAEFDLVDAREAVNATWRVAGERKTAVLVDMRGIRSQSREARALFTSAETAERISAVALLVASPVSRMIANFFLRMGSHPIPTKLFDDEHTARAWLRRMHD